MTYKPKDYPILLIPEPEGGYSALAPDLKGCISEGNTEEEAIRNIREAIALYLEVSVAYGDRIPEPGEWLKKVGLL